MPAEGAVSGRNGQFLKPKSTPVFGNPNGMQGIGGSTRGGLTPAQYYAPAPVYQAPVYQAPAPVYNGGGGGGGFAAPAAPAAPAPPPKPKMTDDQ